MGGQCRRTGWPRRCWVRAAGQGSTQGAGSTDKNPGTGTAAVADREALGRSRGGLSTKIHLAADLRCRPLARVTTAGQRHDSVAFEAVMADLRIERLGPGRPRTRPDAVLADKAYSTAKIRAHLRRRGIAATIPVPSNQVAGRLTRGQSGRAATEPGFRYVQAAQHRGARDQQDPHRPSCGHPV